MNTILVSQIPLGKQAQIGTVGTYWYNLMIFKKNLLVRKSAPERSARMVETIYGCKWSLTVYALMATGVNRPGEMVRSVEGLTTKVLNECLRRNLEFGIIERIIFNESPPHVEYLFTNFGKKFMRVLDELEKLQQDITTDL